MAGSDTSVFSVAKLDEDPLCLYIHWYKGVFDVWVFELMIAPLSKLRMSVSDDLQSATTEGQSFGHMTPSEEDSKILAVMHLSMEDFGRRGNAAEIISRGTHPSLHRQGVMKILSINVLQAFFNVYGNMPVSNESAHIATALYFALSDDERAFALAQNVDGKGCFSAGPYENTKWLLDLLTYHKRRLDLETVIRIPAATLAALSVTTASPTRAAEDDDAECVAAPVSKFSVG